VLKAAEATPLCARAIFQIFADVGAPAGVVNLVTALDPKPIGEVFCTDERVRKLTFTGSTAVGKMLAGSAASNLKRVSVELGGHAPFIVFPDADPVHAAKGAAALKFLNSGQACISPNRLYVHESAHDAFVDTLIQRVGRVKAGNGMDEGVGVGVNNSRSKVGRQAGTNEVCHCPVVSTAWSVCSCIALAVKVLCWYVYTCLFVFFDGNECGRIWSEWI
jgi:succinate-semialdehyde dehydrogenase/glutarate-semialdehyde dehydrogenase